MRSIFKRYLPARHTFQEHRFLKMFGRLLHDPNIWHLTRRSTAGGIATGLFCAYIPLPIHMLVAGAAAIILRVNLPLAVIFTWITNPVTVAPIFIFAYELGATILDRPARIIEFNYSFQWLMEKLGDIWQPLLLGCFILATASAVAGYITVRLLWRLSAVIRWKDRKNRLKQRSTRSR